MKKKIKTQQNKMFVVKKYIMAKSATEALKKERKTPADDCWVDEDWRKGQANQLASAIGFQVYEKEN